MSKRSLILAISIFLLSGCSGNAGSKEKIEAWQAEKRSAFQAFRDRRYDAAIAAYEQALKVAETIDPAGLEVAQTLNDTAAVYHAQDKDGQANALYERSIEILDRLANRDNLNKDVMFAYCDALEGAGKIQRKDNIQAAEQLFAKAVSVAERCNAPAKLRELVYEYKSVLQEEGNEEQLKRVSERFSNLAQDEQVPDKEVQLKLQVKKFYDDATAAMTAGQLAKAEQALNSASHYAEQSADLKMRGEVDGRLAVFYYTTKDYPRAEAYMLEGIRKWREARVGDAMMCSYLLTLANIESELARPQRAEKAARLGYAIAEKQFEPDSAQMQQANEVMVNALTGGHKYEEAVPYFERALAIVQKNNALQSPQVVMHICWMANLYWLANKRPQSEKLVNDYVSSVVRARKDLPFVARLLTDYSNDCKKRNEPEEAKLFAAAAAKVSK
jgi:tetratricopeptide (TPR) repeat protein